MTDLRAEAIARLYERTVPKEPFVPSGLLDEWRSDKTDGEPFLAIDPTGAKEIDDAVRFTPQMDGFKLEVAVADGAQIDPDTTHYQQAIKLGRSIYGIGARDHLIFNDSVLEELSLRGMGKRAIVATQLFDYNAKPKSRYTVEPAWINAENFGYDEVPLKYMMLLGDSQLAIHALGSRLFKDRNFVRHITRNGKKMSLDETFVMTSMVWNNQEMSRWFKQRNIPVPMRVYQCNEPFRAGDGDNQRLIHSHYSHRRKGHEAFTRDYTHFTSPLRRAADLVAHQQWASHVATGAPQYSKNEIKRLSRKFTLQQPSKSSLEVA